MSLFLFEPPKAPPNPLFRMNVNCDPRGKARPKVGRTGRVCRACGTRTGSVVLRNHPADVELESLLGRCAREMMRRLDLKEPLDGPLFCLVVGRWPRIKKMPDPTYSGRQWRASAPDFDNLAKLATDALNGITYHDDRQIVDGHSRTVFAAVHEEPGIEVYLWSADPFPPELSSSTTAQES